MFIDRETLEVDVPPRSELRLDRTGDVDWTLHVQLLHTALHHGKLDRNDTCHLNRATERDLTCVSCEWSSITRHKWSVLTITLGEVKVSNTKLSTLDMHREKDL